MYTLPWATAAPPPKTSPTGALQSTAPVDASNADNVPSIEAANTRPSATAISDCTSPFVGAVHNGCPLARSKAWTFSSEEPTYTRSPAIVGPRLDPPIGADHVRVPSDCR